MNHNHNPITQKIQNISGYLSRSTKMISTTLLVTAAVFAGLPPFSMGISQTNTDQYALNKPASDQFVGNSVWLFGADGVHVYSPDGSHHQHHVTNAQICEDPDTFTGSSWQYCRFNDVQSDGKRFVWAAKRDGQISVLDIDTGSLVGNFKACVGPQDLSVHNLRDEIWIRCSGHDDVNSTESHTHLDVMSASNPSGEIQTDIMLKDSAKDAGLKSDGHSVIHHTLGDVGYLTDNEKHLLFKVDLTSKEIIKTVDLYPTVHGLNDMAYSPRNGHIYVRALMCCTCGSAESDLTSCGRSGAYKVSPTTGKGAGLTDIDGVCGRSCSGVEGVDSVGVYEFDTKSESVVATHVLAEGIGGEPYASHDGKYIVLLGKNGGSTVRVLEAGEPGLSSTLVADIELDFSRDSDRYDNLSVARDFAFVEILGKTYLAFPSGTSHTIAIVDFDNFNVRHVTLTEAVFENTAPHGRYRGVEWAVGTPYVWTNDSTEDEHYVVDVVNAKVVNTIRDVDRSTMVSVQNWARVREAEEREKMMTEIKTMQEQAIQKQAQATLVTVTDQEKAREAATKEDILKQVRREMNTKSEESVSVSVMSATKAEETAERGGNATSTAALIVGAIALAVGIVNLYTLHTTRGQLNSTETAKFVVGVPSSAAGTKNGDSSVADSESAASNMQNVL